MEQGYVTDDRILQTLSARFKVPIADLSALDRRVAPLLPESLARKYAIVPIGADDTQISIATADPRDLAMEQTLAFVTGREVQLQAAAPTAIAEKIEDLYRPEVTINRLVDGLDPPQLEQVVSK